ncbi:MAG: DUF3251 domain-containing protein [Desulfoplanes sp.]
MLRILLLILIASASLLFTGCDSINNLQKTQKTISIQAGQIKGLEQKVESLQTELEKIKQIQSDFEISKTIQNWEKIAYLQPGDEGYKLIRFNMGILPVCISDVKPYANGSKVNLQFGNLLASSITGLKAEIDWGRINKKGFADNKTAKTKKYNFSKPLLSGKWTTFSVILEGIPAIELGFVRIRKVTNSGISLNE